MKALSEPAALARLQREKRAYQSHIKLVYEPAARSCRACLTPGVCCTDAHFVNVHITRLEAVAIRDTLARTPRLTDDARRAVLVDPHRRFAAVGRGALSQSHGWREASNEDHLDHGAARADRRLGA